MNEEEFQLPETSNTTLGCSSYLVYLVGWGVGPMWAWSAISGQANDPLRNGLVGLALILLPFVFKKLFSTTDRYLVEDGKLRSSQRLMGKTRIKDVAPLTDLTRLVEEPGKSNCRLYVYDKTGGRTLLHMMKSKPYVEVKAYGQLLGEKLGVPFLPSSEGDEPGWDAIRPGAEAGQIVLDPDTVNEKLFGCGIFLFVPLLVLIGISPGPTFIWPCVIAVALVNMRGKFEEYYVVDFAKNEFLFAKDTYKHRVRKRMCSLSELKFAAVNSQKIGRRYASARWTYGIALIDESGRTYQVVNTADIGTHEGAVEKAGKFAELLDLELVVGEPERILHVKKTPEGPQLEYGSNWRNELLGGVMGLGCALSIPFIMLGGFLLLMILAKFSGG